MKKQVKANPGDYINIRTTKENIEGTLLESHEPDIFLLKLKSGYNIGIKKEDIYDIRVIRKSKPEESSEKEKAAELKSKKELPNIAMIMTGGTISSRLDPLTGGVKWLTSPADFFKFYPELFGIANIKKLEIPFMIASENMSSREWKKIAKVAAELLNDPEIKGIIITHGTDTLHYTASALSFFLKNLNKPVILTYSQRSTDRASSDASLNLQCAAQAAVSDIAEVMLVGHASTNDDFCYAMQGTKVRKMHSSRRDAFKCINSKPIAKIFPGRIEILSQYNKRNNSKVKLNAVFEDKVALVKFHPGMNPDIIDYYAKNCRGIVIEMTGLGHLATKEAYYNLLPKLKQAIKRGLVICAAPQTLYGWLDPYVYSPGRELLKAGINKGKNA
ncbi:Glu-tRNA(Gln) amidotransferase subunit GatD [Candidatus Pacearchaeota archaeon]|nr:Glu-tRNA(Gln) amidotransferase subunit GatD [Candidatus Pacearchaeota archaeon]